MNKHLRPGDRLRLRFATAEPTNGTVTQVDRDGGFSVTFDGHGRKRGAPRYRHSYPASALIRFELLG